jgi:hypothetical protein
MGIRGFCLVWAFISLKSDIGKFADAACPSLVSPVSRINVFQILPKGDLFDLLQVAVVQDSSNIVLSIKPINGHPRTKRVIMKHVNCGNNTRLILENLEGRKIVIEQKVNESLFLYLCDSSIMIDVVVEMNQ